MIQTSLVWENPEANREVLSAKMEEIGEAVDLIVLPEMFTTGFTMTPENILSGEAQKSLEWMREKVREYNAGLIGSIVYAENDRYYNRLFFVDPEGDVQKYDKRHTFTLAGEDKKYKAGEHRLVFTFRGFRICPLICYDLRFPVWSRNTEQYDLLLYVANWPAPRIGAWDTLLRARAIENMSYCVGVNRVGKDENDLEYPGHSAAYDCLGNRLVFSTEEDILQTVLSKEHLKLNRDKLQFLNDRDNFTLEP